MRICVEDDDIAQLSHLGPGQERLGDPNKKGHRGGQVVHEVLRQDWDEDVLPEHRIYQGVGCLHTGGQARQAAAGHDDSPFMEHAGKYPDHEGAVHGVVVLRQVPVLRDAGKVEVGRCWSSEHTLAPAHVERQPVYRDPRAVDTGEE